MNKELFVALCDRIETNVPEIRYIDFDSGQLNLSTERPPVDYPCCLIDIAYTACRDLKEEDGMQLVTADVTLRVAFAPAGETHHRAPDTIRQTALRMFDIVEKLHNALQHCTLGDTVSALSRVRAAKQTRANRIVVFNITYTTTFYEYIFESEK